MENETANQGLDSKFSEIFDKMLNLDYSRFDEIKSIETEIYAGLQKSPDNLDGLIILMNNQIMQGNRTKAQAIAYKIWEMGGSLSTLAELLYINNLLDIGLLEMASVMLKTRFEEIHNSIADFFPVMQKFALMTGNIALLDKINACKEVEGTEDMQEICGLYKELKCSEHLKNAQKIIIENLKDNLCSYEYAFYDDRGFTEIEITAYVNLDTAQSAKLEEVIEQKLTAYWTSSGQKRLNNIGLRVESIRNHPAIIPNQENEELPYKSNW